MLSHVTNQVDRNNIKALAVISLAIIALENGCDDFDVTTIMEVIKDYLKSNDKILDGLA